ncbi:MAG: J domain-containing protein [Myxococcota bacterium]|nr:J domain-containing protein [Myxococcota bacterium]
MALLRVLAVAALVFVVTRWLRKALSKQTGKSSPSGKPWWDGQKRQTTDTKPKLTTLDFKRGPHDILGVEKGASMSAIEAAYLALLAKNSPEAVAGMSEDIQALARRNTAEINEAYAALQKDND